MTLPPPKCGERGAFYPVFERSELSASARYTIAIPATLFAWIAGTSWVMLTEGRSVSPKSTI